MARSDLKAGAGKKRIRIIAQGGGAAFLSSLLLIFLASFCISKGWLRLAAAWKLAVASCAMGGFLATLVTLRRVGSKPVVPGVLIGLIQFALFLLLGLLTSDRFSPGADQLPLLAACLCSCTLAGLLTKKGKKKRRM